MSRLLLPSISLKAASSKASAAARSASAAFSREANSFSPFACPDASPAMLRPSNTDNTTAPAADKALDRLDLTIVMVFIITSAVRHHLRRATFRHHATHPYS